jgi:15-cis-phytoene synthase
MDELTAAGITDPQLRASYEECKRLNALHGKTYYLATLLLPKAKRPFVHALYGFARYADEIVDDLASTLTDAEKAAELKTWGDSVLSGLKSGDSNDQVGRSMTMDLTVTEYANYEALMEYVYGSAAVIGLEMVPILGALSQGAYEPAEKLGVAFQLANFIRDVGEDLDRGRVYLPQDELAQFGVDREMLEARKLTPEITAALKLQIERVRQLQREATPGILQLERSSRPCIEAASELYCGIVDEVEAIGYDIFNKRAKTSTARRMRVAGKAYVKAIAAR